MVIPVYIPILVFFFYKNDEWIDGYKVVILGYINFGGVGSPRVSFNFVLL